MKKIIISVFAMISLSQSASAISTQCEYINNVKSFEEFKASDIPCVTEVIADAMNASTPTRIDKITTLTALTAVSDGLVYNYQLTNLPKDLNTTLAKQKMEPILRNTNCTTPDVKKLINLGVKITHSYYNDKGKFLFKVNVDKSICDKINKK